MFQLPAKSTMAFIAVAILVVVAVIFRAEMVRSVVIGKTASDKLK